MVHIFDIFKELACHYMYASFPTLTNYQFSVLGINWMLYLVAKMSHECKRPSVQASSETLQER